MIESFNLYKTIRASLEASQLIRGLASLKKFIIPYTKAQQYKEKIREVFSKTFKSVKTVLDESKERCPGLRQGSKNVAPIDFRALTCEKLPWSDYCLKQFEHVGCGNLMLAQLTGAHPFEVQRFMIDHIDIWLDLPENQKMNRELIMTGKYTPVEMMLSFLVMHGIIAEAVTVMDLCPRVGVIETLITKNHVLLISQQVSRDESTWCVIHNGKIRHNLEVGPLDPYYLLCNPPTDLFVLWSPDWGISLTTSLGL